MAGVSINVDVRDLEVTRALRKLLSNAKDLEPFFKDAGESLLQSTLDRFEAEKSPQGEKWDPLSEPYRTYKARKKPKAKILTFDQHLRRLGYRTSKDELELGANRKYAAIHQLGGLAGPKKNRVKIPSRPYLGLSDADREELLELLGEHLAE